MYCAWLASHGLTRLGLLSHHKLTKVDIIHTYFIILIVHFTKCFVVKPGLEGLVRVRNSVKIGLLLIDENYIYLTNK